MLPPRSGVGGSERRFRDPKEHPMKWCSLGKGRARERQNGAPPKTQRQRFWVGKEEQGSGRSFRPQGGNGGKRTLRRRRATNGSPHCSGLCEDALRGPTFCANRKWGKNGKGARPLTSPYPRGVLPTPSTGPKECHRDPLSSRKRSCIMLSPTGEPTRKSITSRWHSVCLFVPLAVSLHWHKFT